ncbi:hypothetical protein ABZ845_23145 [Streptomyces sp. NPDC047022]|uniref:hypothetical protein n=1 Tax=Streptomyces sp. NPDC047022 TaxID=3155737 RepID=UPI0033EE8839
MADTHRTMRSGTVVLGGMGLLAAALTSCSSAPDKRCVDSDSYRLGQGYRVIADKNCTSSTTGTHSSWYYGGNKKSGWVDGGTFTKPGRGSGGSSGSHSGVKRGGFGGHHGSSGG